MPDFALDPSPHPTCIIAEADPFLARLLQRFAEKSGLRTQRAQTGEDVLDLVEAGHPALVVIEPELPGKVRGWEAAQTLQNNNLTRAIPVILCAWLPEAEARALAGHAFPHLHKPDLHYEDFVAALVMAGVKINIGGSQ